MKRAAQGRAGQGRAGQSRAGQGRAEQGRAGQGRAGQGRAGKGGAEQGQDRQVVVNVHRFTRETSRRGRLAASAGARRAVQYAVWSC